MVKEIASVLLATKIARLDVAAGYFSDRSLQVECELLQAEIRVLNDLLSRQESATALET